jgi:PAS domain S-box-containing protein
MRKTVWSRLILIQLCTVVLFLTTAAHGAPRKNLTLGVLAFRPMPETQAKWQPLADYLTHALPGTTVRLEVFSYTELEAALDGNRLDFVLTNPSHYIQLRHKNNLSGALATLVDSDKGVATGSLGGVIFTRQDREDISDLGHLKGKTIAAVSTGSLGGYQAQALELLHAGVLLPRDARIITTGMPHDLAVEAVLQGKADAGFVRTGVLEAMTREGRIDMSRLKVLSRRDVPAFPDAVSTQLYPEWPFIALPHVDDDISRHVAAALLDLEHGGGVARKGGFHGFTIPADYTPVENLLLELRLPPFDSSPVFTVQDVWQRYRSALIALMIAVLIIVLLTIRLVISNRQLVIARKTSREAEEKIRQSLSLLKAALQSTADGILVVADNGGITDFNEQFVKMWGISGAVLDPRDDQKTMDFVLDQLKDPEHFIAKVRELHADPEATSYDVLEFKDGRIFERYSQSQKIEGKPVGRVWSFRDITERKKSEDALRQSEQRIRALIEASSQIVWSCNSLGEAVEDSPSWRAYTGQTFEQWSGYGYVECIHPDDRETVMALWKDGLRKGISVTNVYRLRHHSGEWRWNHARGVPLRDHTGTVVSWIGMNIDIHERKQAEEALRQSEERYRALIEASSQIVWTCDPLGRITDYSPSWRAYTGQILDQRGGYGYVECMHPDDREAVMDRWKNGLQKGTSVSAELRLLHHSGEWRWNHVRAVPIRDKAGTVVSWVGMYIDIHERKKAEERIKELAQELKMILDTLTVGVAFLKDRTVQWANTAHDKIYGFDIGESTALDTSTFYVDEAAYQRVGTEGYARLATGAEYTTEVEMKRKDGTRFWSSLTGRAVDPDNIEEGSIWMLQDITDRRRMATALQERENFLRTIIETEPDCIKLLSHDGSLLQMNRAGLSMIDAGSFDEVKGQCIYPLIVPEYRETFKAVTENAFRGKSGILEFEAVGLKGRRVWLETHAVPLRNEKDEVTSALGITRDIGKRKQAEVMQREALANLQALAEHVQQGVLFEDANRCIKFANHTFCELFGIPAPKAVLGTNCTQMSSQCKVFFAKPDEFIENVTQRVADSRIVLSEELRLVDGRVFERDYIPVTVEGKQYGHYWIYRDITGRRQEEVALRDKTLQLETLTRTLEQRVHDEVALRIKNEQLLVQQSKLAAMGEMLGAIAHQWRQPLNILGLIVQNAHDAFAYGDLNKAYMEKTVQNAMAQIQHMSKTIDDFRNFFMPDKEKTVFDAMRAVGDVLFLFSAQLAANDITFTFNCHTHGTRFESVDDIIPCPEKALKGFRNEFEHVILNLVNNAKDAILDRREKVLPGTVLRGSLSFDFYQAEGRLVIKVTDNGGGIPPGALNRIFEPYFTTKDPVRGTGLGLYMSKIIIEDHMQGKLSAHNHAQGATFTIELPLSEKEA